MIEAVLPYPQIDPVLVHLGPLAIRWYALSYIAGLLLGWWYLVRLIRTPALWAGATFCGRPPATADDIGDLVVWTTLGVIVGGRLGYVLIYGTFFCGIWGTSPACAGLPLGYLTDPIKIIAAWEGGMSFHGGLVGVAIAIWLFTRHRKLDILKIGDLVASVTPIGLFFGRIANFINGELWGKVTDVPWAMVFPRAPDQLPRHPSQLYEAGMEGLLLFVIMQLGLRVFHLHDRPGLLAALFFTCYGIFRYIAEIFRDSDTVFPGWLSVGQALSIPMWVAAAVLFWLAFRRPLAQARA
ncbi:MAG TPA: prolipoprotein diacylglyceryl transferase [Rhizomicrobium sp.]|jgi:phosphatidylglycerol:prolipoprotein diacylglycerol transferase|nr:prolipoprotein diacylglyceryl transferase [Rhizomicrobium sp.]